MQPVSARRGKGFLGDAVLFQLAGGNRFVYSGQILVNNSSGAEVEMADFRVSHLSFRQTHIRSACAQFTARKIAIELVVKRRVREQGGITILFCLRFTAWINAPAIANNEHDRR